MEIGEGLSLDVLFTLLQMVDKMESTIALMESRLGAKLDSIEERLDRLEASSTELAPIMTSCSVRVDFRNYISFIVHVIKHERIVG